MVPPRSQSYDQAETAVQAELNFLARGLAWDQLEKQFYRDAIETKSKQFSEKFWFLTSFDIQLSNYGFILESLDYMGAEDEDVNMLDDENSG